MSLLEFWSKNRLKRSKMEQMDDSRDFARSGVFHPKKRPIGRFDAALKSREKTRSGFSHPTKSPIGCFEEHWIPERKPGRAFPVREKTRPGVLAGSATIPCCPIGRFYLLPNARSGVFTQYPFLPFFSPSIKGVLLHFRTLTSPHHKLREKSRDSRRLKARRLPSSSDWRRKILPNILREFYYLFLLYFPLMFLYFPLS